MDRPTMIAFAAWAGLVAAAADSLPTNAGPSRLADACAELANKFGSNEFTSPLLAVADAFRLRKLTNAQLAAVLRAVAETLDSRLKGTV